MYFNISVDADTYATDYLISGCDTEKMVVASYDTGLRKLLIYFQQKNIQVTIFVIASHMKIPFIKSFLRQAVADGNEIASHSFSHLRNFSLLEPDKMNEEIKKARDILRDALGVEIKGFRAPGYTINKKVFELLIRNGFAYDSSLNNGFFYWAFKNAYKILSSKGHFFVTQRFGEFPFSSEPFEVTQRYFNSNNMDKLWEIPLDYSKIICFPLSIFMLNQLPKTLAYSLAKTAIKSNKELTQIQFHDYDFLDAEDMKKFSSILFLIKKYNKKPFEERRIFYDGITSDLLNHRMPILLKNYAQMKSEYE